MAENVIPGAEAFSFGSLSLHGNLQTVSDTDEQEVAEHRVLKRDGAILEPMGWRARRYEAKLMFVGPNFRADVQKIRDAIRRKSEDVLVHPLHGRMTARCTKITGALNIPAEVNAAPVTLTFVESGIDPNQTATLSQSGAAKSQALTSQAADFEALAALYLSAGAVTANAALVAGAGTYAADALYAARSGVPNSALAAQVTAIEGQAVVAIVAIQADPAQTLDVDRFDALGAADLVYAAALDLQDALGQLRPAVVATKVPGPQSYLALLGTLYGDQALDREAEFALYNPGITTPHLIPAGTVVYLPQPTI